MKYLIFSFILMIIGLGGILYAGIMQMILCYNLYGVIINHQHLIISHISLLGYFGIIPFSIGSVMIKIGE